MGYARDILREASDRLNTNDSTIQARLCAAGILMTHLDVRDFRDLDLRNQFTTIMKALTAVRGQVPATTTAMNDETAKRIATNIHNLSSALENLS